MIFILPDLSFSWSIGNGFLLLHAIQRKIFFSILSVEKLIRKLVESPSQPPMGVSSQKKFAFGWSWASFVSLSSRVLPKFGSFKQFRIFKHFLTKF
jgi:hypothetical protein